MEKVIVLDNEEYLVCNEITLDNVEYIYAVSMDGNKYTVLNRINTAEGSFVESVVDEEIIKKVMQYINQENN